MICSHLLQRFFLVYEMKGDVYPVESDEGFLVNQVLDAHWGVLRDEDVSILAYTRLKNGYC